MPYNKIEELPQDIQDKLPQHAQQIFCAAFNASQHDGLSEAGATDVAWNSVRNEYEQSQNGEWHRKAEDTAIHNKSVTSGGN
ncbi:ChaB family protein [Nostoc sp. FACHB-87]|uniref:ChaB family protein n=1 Tax=Nostocales TaxID=1161 RepID=UPI00168A2157|nr:MULTISPECIES: ChaB family protein [Nostocales]MBD2302890.1 ChaB family protein [Nostoc sp. FACHB-190]MBD2453927.1 ChaB family protein [Nostoc sp. FACHB-87]MBD2476052.1 ChaB family protein [Anabaena sp. FACHB-83]MBD2489719.1 ChaB family protein [Aulosira sp. FACHB-615]